MAALRRTLASSRGQIAIPALFVIPSLFLFVFLIYETAKLSREKIRHQFAADAASFVEMTNYADFLNRTAYVNGAFPQRIFAEGFMNGPMIPMKKNDALKTSLYDILFCNGAFPRMGGSTDGLPSAGTMDSLGSWDIKFNESGGCGTQPVEDSLSVPEKNDATPQLNGTCPNGTGSCLNLLTMKNALQYYLSWEDAQDIYKLYVQIYQLLGSVEDAQYSVFKRLTQGANPHTFYRKSYWLNTGDNVGNARDGASYFTKHSFEPKAVCYQQINIVGNKPTNDPYQPYKQVMPEKPIDMPKTVTNELCSPEGLFQVAYMQKSQLRELTRDKMSGLSDWPGYAVVQHWQPPPNYFKVTFNDVCDFGNSPEGNACVHSTISLTGPQAVVDGSAGIWPNPTPKFQTRLYP